MKTAGQHVTPPPFFEPGTEIHPPIMSFGLLLSLVGFSLVLIVVLTSVLKFNTFISMFVVSLLLAGLTLPAHNVVPVITEGFGSTMKTIGLIIILGVMIGVLLERTGATTSLGRALLRLTGEKKASLAVGLTGVVVGIPIFCNSGFIVLSGLNKSLVQRTGRPMIQMATMLAAGLYSVHCLIPPHPGAMAAAGLLKPNIGSLLLTGLLVALPAAAAGFAWTRFCCRHEPVGPGEAAGTLTQPDGQALPSAGHAILPILVPLVLMAGRSVILLQPRFTPDLGWVKAVDLLGSPEVALLIGVALAVTLLKKIEIKTLGELFEKAIEQAGPTLALTAAGGMFGAVIKATQVGEQAGVWLAASGLGLFIPFVVAAFLKTAQGSSTVATMTAASIVAPMLPGLQLDTEAGKVLATLALGAGSMVVSHANDSYFWVVTKFSNLETGNALRVYTTATLVMGLTAFTVVWVLSKFML